VGVDPLRVATIFGTRPEIIKLAPVVRRLRDEDAVEVITVATAQHRDLLDQVLELFKLDVDVDLDLMQDDQALDAFVARALTSVGEVLRDIRPDVVLVQGDTNTAMAAALSAFYAGIPVGHVEAGLRSHNRRHPFPEEVNRRVISTLADLHFAPTEGARANLLAEGVKDESVIVTGNTIVDALQMLDLEGSFEDTALSRLSFDGAPLVLLTAHRRENFGAPLRRVCAAVRCLVEQRDLTVVYPVHPNPNVRGVVDDELGGHERIHLVPPVGYADMLKLLDRCDIALTDSGGIQEEAPSFGTPVLVLREVTERPEVVECGAGRLVGTDERVIVTEVERLLDDRDHYRTMANARNPFGDGRAAERIVDVLRKRLAITP
jgi:UDP-N-acetylglucosamine 2-epimerase (non-hydrolysing)